MVGVENPEVSAVKVYPVLGGSDQAPTAMLVKQMESEEIESGQRNFQQQAKTEAENVDAPTPPLLPLRVITFMMQGCEVRLPKHLFYGR